MYYNNCVRNHSGIIITELLTNLRVGNIKEIVLDIRDNFLCCNLNYGLRDTYVGLKDSVLVTRYGSDYIVIDCSEYIPGYNICNFLNGNITVHDILEKRNYRNVYRGELFWDNIRPILRITL